MENSVPNKMSGTAKRRILRLKERLNWLDARVAIAADEGKRYHYAIAEATALRWATEELEKVFGPAGEAI